MKDLSSAIRNGILEWEEKEKGKGSKAITGLLFTSARVTSMMWKVIE